MNDIEKQIHQHACDNDTEHTMRIITINHVDHTPTHFIKSIQFDFKSQATIELTSNIQEAQRFTFAFSCMLYHHLSEISEAKYHSHYPIK